MIGRVVFLTIVCGLILLTGCYVSQPPRPQESCDPKLAPLLRAMEAVKPLHTKMGKPKLYDWLAEHPEEKGQTFAEYLKANPVLPTEQRKTIYVQPLGEFTEQERRIVHLTSEYLTLFFNLPVKQNEALPLSLAPNKARRASPLEKGVEQIQSSFVRDQILKPRLPGDAAAMIAFTSADLYPGAGWNYVFGEASLIDRVGVWSIHRFGNPDSIYGDFQLVLLRTLKLATHETGHMFSIPHCTKYECNMSGTNHIGETDSRGLDVCPECMAKICWGMKYDPLQRYEKLAEFCRVNQLGKEQKYFAAAARAIKQSYS
ncbi:MAG TPA: archaemetzincin [Blastocatellia bacterium]|nr:archaemetzincin [Blastocatellia bacterium]